MFASSYGEGYIITLDQEENKGTSKLEQIWDSHSKYEKKQDGEEIKGDGEM